MGSGMGSSLSYSGPLAMRAAVGIGKLSLVAVEQRRVGVDFKACEGFGTAIATLEVVAVDALRCSLDRFG